MSITVDIQNRYEQFRRTNSTAAFIKCAVKPPPSGMGI